MSENLARKYANEAPARKDSVDDKAVANDSFFLPEPYAIENTSSVNDTNSELPTATIYDFSPKVTHQSTPEDTTTVSTSFPAYSESDIEVIDMEKVLSEKELLLTREDFTPEAIYQERVRLGRSELNGQDPDPISPHTKASDEGNEADQNMKPRPELGSKYPDNFKIEDNLRVANKNAVDRRDFPTTRPNTTVKANDTVYAGTIQPDNRYKIKFTPPPAKKSFFSRFMPKFISNIFKR